MQPTACRQAAQGTRKLCWAAVLGGRAGAKGQACGTTCDHRRIAPGSGTVHPHRKYGYREVIDTDMPAKVNTPGDTNELSLRGGSFFRIAIGALQPSRPAGASQRGWVLSVSNTN